MSNAKRPNGELGAGQPRPFCHVSSEAAEGGPIALLKAGDGVRIDFPNRRIDVCVPEAELAERKRTWQPVKRPLTGWLARYREIVTNASQGGVLGHAG